MKKSATVAATAIALMMPLGTAMSSEKKIQKQDLPAAVQKSIEEQARGAQIKGYARETEEGKVFYEAETVVHGKTRDLLFDPSGKLVEVEEETTLASIPPAAREAIQKKAAGGKIQKVEIVTKGQVVSYGAAIVSKSGKESEVAVNADGSTAH